ncbi:MAG: LTA synthase family protein [Lachnospiraceae bacterium]|nr:LTA synthase family protein [Lachnospiraceae bacterium]
MYKKFPVGILFFPVLFAFMECVLHVSIFKTVDTGLLFAVLFAFAYGVLAFGLTSFKNRIVNRIMLVLITTLTVVYFALQAVFYNIFKVFISVYSISQNAGDAREFWKEALHGIIASTPQLIFIIVIPVIAVAVMTRLGFIGTGLLSSDAPKAGAASADHASGGNTGNSADHTSKEKSNGSAGHTSGENMSGSAARDNEDTVEKLQSEAAAAKETKASDTDADSFADEIPEIVSKAPVPEPAAVSPVTAARTLPSPVLRLVILAGAVLLYFGVMFSLRLAGTDANSSYDLYNGNFVLDLGIQKLGVLTSAGLDVKQVLFDSGSRIDLADSSDLTSLDMADALVMPGLPSPVPVSESAADTKTPAADESVPQDIDNENNGTGSLDTPDGTAPTSTPVPPTPTPIDTSPNVFDIDFAALAESESKKEIKKLHEYFAGVAPTKKNEYTGMFKGYNLIYLTCEGYSPWAVDENVTPTLYKLTHSGFVFTNFYNPIWYTSTSDGEYVECQGLLPYNTNSFKRSKTNALPLCFGWQFLKLGYNCRAYHAHTATYYGRNETHPNMGYTFKAKGAGLAMTDVWPESDLEMVQLSLPEYINDEHFHTYYMTVSGHLEYSFSGNYQARKNKELTDDLPYGSEVRAYLACNIELDRALEYLIDELDKAGKLDRTVIAFGGDHYPYGLSDAAIDEVAGEHVERNFELYRNNFVLWNSQITEPIVVDKYCSSLDMMPTLSNLFGLEYDSRLFMGSDILSDAPALVIFGNQSFITDYCKYNSKTREITMLREDIELPQDYISSVSKIVQNKFAVSKNILLNDYYRYLLDYIPGVVTKVPDTYD